MTEPTTPTGRRLDTDLAYDSDPADYLPGDYLKRYRDDIKAIEREAAAAERARIAEAVKAISSGCHSHSGLNCEKDEYGWCYLIDRSDVLHLVGEK